VSAEPMTLHFVVPQMLDDLPEEVKNSIAVRRSLYATGTCPTCDRVLPTAEELQRFNASMDVVKDDPTAQSAREGTLAAYFSHAEWCRGREHRLLAIAKRNSVTADVARWSVISFDVANRELVEETLVPEGMSPAEVVEAYRRVMQEGK
jgi:hypothetical protein